MFENVLSGLRHFRRSIGRRDWLTCRRGYRPAVEHLEDRWAPATITVNNVSDGIFNHNPAVVPATLGQVVTLRDAIKAANNDTANTGNTDTIVLLAGTYILNNVDNTTLGANALPAITGNIIIQDAGSLPVVLNVAGTSMRLFDVEAAGHLTLQSITLSGGTAQGQSGGQGFSGGGGAAGLGGAIFNQGTVSIFDCTFTANKAVGGAGGSVGTGNAGAGAGFAGGAGSTQNGVAGGTGGFGGGGGGGDSSVGGNGGFGGGAGGSNSTVGGTGGFGGGNAGAAAGGGGAALGGAIFNDEGTLNIINSTITNNSATAGASGTGGGGNPGAALGAGVFNYNGTLDSFNDTIVSNTLAGNAVAQNAADVYNLGNGATDTQQGAVSQGAITVTLTFPTPGAQPNAIINTGNLTGTSITASVVTTTVGAAPLTDAVQTLSFGGNITGGWFTLTLGGAGGPTTAPIAWTDSPTGLAANIRAAVSNLDATYAVAANQGGSADGFPDAVSATLVFSNPAALEADTTLVIGTTSVDGQGNFDNTLIGSYATAAALPVDGLQTVGFSGNITGGSFALGFTFTQGQPVIFTNNIAWSDNPALLASNIQAAVNALFGALNPSDSVTVGAATVEDLAFPAVGPQPSVTVNTGNLTATPNAAIIDVADGAFPDVKAGQAIEFTGGITGGTFTLTLTGANGAAGADTTAPIAWSSNPSTLAANIRFAIDNLVDGLSPSVGAGTSVDSITFPFPSHFTLVANATGLTAGANGTPAVSVSLNNNVATVTFGGDIVGGSFILVDGTQTVPVAWSNDPATLAANLQAALNELAPAMTGVDLSNGIIGQYVDQSINSGANYSTGSNNLAVTDAVAAGQTLTFTTVANTAALQLGALANNGGFTQTLELLDGSPAAISGANLTDLFKTYGLGATDQRGVNRGTFWSIGAYQDSTPGRPAGVTLVAGSAKAGIINKAYATTLQVLVTDAFGNPVSGVIVTFNAPTTGPTVTFSTPFVTVGTTGKTSTAIHKGVKGVTGTTNASGIATATLVANSKTGTFNITVTVNGVATPLTVSLTNLA